MAEGVNLRDFFVHGNVVRCRSEKRLEIFPVRLATFDSKSIAAAHILHLL